MYVLRAANARAYKTKDNVCCGKIPFHTYLLQAVTILVTMENLWLTNKL